MLALNANNQNVTRSTGALKLAIIDPIVNGLNSGWQHIDASLLQANQQFEADVIIVGTGAGGRCRG